MRVTGARPKLIQTGSTKALQIVLSLGVQPHRHFRGDPRQRNIGLGAAKFLQRGRGDRAQTGHASRSGEDPVRADEIGTFADALSRQPHRLIVIASDELPVGGDAMIDRRKRVARAQPQRATRGRDAFLPTPAIGKG